MNDRLLKVIFAGFALILLLFVIWQLFELSKVLEDLLPNAVQTAIGR